ncbi:pyruvate/2-oxoglutarate dehydrogenase complex dihydrolipoamide acyltransferase (E2) component [Pseudochrobactrum saccharolyticum]|uniref:Pyruvate/2-oxoglutarate dehydrogenase complex dihydrolipoamide acyltransferase (E2) component n=1 Tax=Pseudochrobactrum saccharolyticum TaxID=354352 RepID=A0A7W8AJ84_9HYPH|nr:hypothetical protein [Pseudochrobactrum saccharolyticum]KAB0538137.1 hypothetical protein F7P81_10450 [Pseudochrobactrum saccharolyticum]MBB5091369.1 pyruvate/2-oxoglutarate dehydrogenase complex dihydrolipoamide acyltransferase (E2) component [Pseudochrobactrum saccharolyticum]
MVQTTQNTPKAEKARQSPAAKAKPRGNTNARAIAKRQPVHKTAATAVAKEAYQPDARALALLRGVEIAQQDLREAGGAYTLEQVRLLLQGISRQAVDKRVQDGSLLAVPGPGNRRAYPTIQFLNDGSIVAGLKAVRQALGSANPWFLLNFLSRPDERLNGKKPIELLHRGETDAVLEAARLNGLQGA